MFFWNEITLILRLCYPIILHHSSHMLWFPELTMVVSVHINLHSRIIILCKLQIKALQKILFFGRGGRVLLFLSSIKWVLTWVLDLQMYLHIYFFTWISRSIYIYIIRYLHPLSNRTNSQFFGFCKYVCN